MCVFSRTPGLVIYLVELAGLVSGGQKKVHLVHSSYDNM